MNAKLIRNPIMHSNILQFFAKATNEFPKLSFLSVCILSFGGCSASISKCEFYEISTNSPSIRSEAFDGECTFLLSNHNLRYIITKDSFQISITNSGRWFSGLYANISPSGRYAFKEDSIIRASADAGLINRDLKDYKYHLTVNAKEGTRILYIIKLNQNAHEEIIDSVEIRYKVNDGRFVAMNYI